MKWLAVIFVFLTCLVCFQLGTMFGRLQQQQQAWMSRRIARPCVEAQR